MAYSQKLSHGVQNLMEVGEISSGVTPKTVIYQEDKLTLLQKYERELKKELEEVRARIREIKPGE